MRVLTFILLAIFSISAYAQKSPLEKFTKKYAFGEGITITEISPGSTDFSKAFGEEEIDLKEMLNQIEVIKIINCDNEMTSAATRETFYDKAVAAVNDKRYVVLANIHTDDEAFSVYTQEKNGIIKEFAVLFKDGPDVGMIYVKGEIDLTNFDSKPFLSVLNYKNKGKDCKKTETGGE